MHAVKLSKRIVCVCPSLQGMKLKAGQQLVSMTVLPPELAQQIAAAQAAAKAAAAAEPGADTPSTAEAAPDAQLAATDSSSSSTDSETSHGPWLLLVTRLGFGKRVSLYDIPRKEGRGVQGVIGIKLSTGEPYTQCSVARLHPWVGANSRCCIMSMMTTCAQQPCWPALPSSMGYSGGPDGAI